MSAVAEPELTESNVLGAEVPLASQPAVAADDNEPTDACDISQEAPAEPPATTATNTADGNEQTDAAAPMSTSTEDKSVTDGVQDVKEGEAVEPAALPQTVMDVSPPSADKADTEEDSAPLEAEKRDVADVPNPSANPPTSASPGTRSTSGTPRQTRAPSGITKPPPAAVWITPLKPAMNTPPPPSSFSVFFKQSAKTKPVSLFKSPTLAPTNAATVESPGVVDNARATPIAASTADSAAQHDEVSPAVKINDEQAFTPTPAPLSSDVSARPVVSTVAQPAAQDARPVAAKLDEATSFSIEQSALNTKDPSDAIVVDFANSGSLFDGGEAEPVVATERAVEGQGAPPTAEEAVMSEPRGEVDVDVKERFKRMVTERAGASTQTPTSTVTAPTRPVQDQLITEFDPKAAVWQPSKTTAPPTLRRVDEASGAKASPLPPSQSASTLKPAPEFHPSTPMGHSKPVAPSASSAGSLKPTALPFAPIAANQHSPELWGTSNDAQEEKAGLSTAPSRERNGASISSAAAFSGDVSTKTPSHAGFSFKATSSDFVPRSSTQESPSSSTPTSPSVSKSEFSANVRPFTMPQDATASTGQSYAWNASNTSETVQLITSPGVQASRLGYAPNTMVQQPVHSPYARGSYNGAFASGSYGVSASTASANGVVAYSVGPVSSFIAVQPTSQQPIHHQTQPLQPHNARLASTDDRERRLAEAERRADDYRAKLDAARDRIDALCEEKEKLRDRASNDSGRQREDLTKRMEAITRREEALAAREEALKAAARAFGKDQPAVEQGRDSMEREREVFAAKEKEWVQAWTAAKEKLSVVKAENQSLQRQTREAVEELIGFEHLYNTMIQTKETAVNLSDLLTVQIAELREDNVKLKLRAEFYQGSLAEARKEFEARKFTRPPMAPQPYFYSPSPATSYPGLSTEQNGTSKPTFQVKGAASRSLERLSPQMASRAWEEGPVRSLI